MWSKNYYSLKWHFYKKFEYSNWLQSFAFEFSLRAPIVLKLGTHKIHVHVHVHIKFHRPTRSGSRATLVSLLVSRICHFGTSVWKRSIRRANFDTPYLRFYVAHSVQLSWRGTRVIPLCAIQNSSHSVHAVADNPPRIIVMSVLRISAIASILCPRYLGSQCS